MRLWALWCNRTQKEKLMDRLVSMNEVCEILGVGRSTVYRMIDAGRLPEPASLGDKKKSRKVWRESVITKTLDDIMPSASDA
jgi:excisionase family DNA binding protein